MAKVNLFTAARIAMEEEDIGTSSSVNNDVAQNEVENIEAQNEVEEVAKLTSEIEQVASQIEEGIDEGEKLDEAIVEGEEVLENNEGGDVPEEAVEVAQEALSESILLLAGREGKKQFKPSLESYETNIQKLRVSLEAAKDFANNVWQKIKELFAKFVVMIKKFALKLGAMFDKGAKQAEALKKIFEQRKVFDSEKVTDEFKDRLAKTYPAFIKYPGIKYVSTIGDNVSAMIESRIKSIPGVVKDFLNGQPKPDTLSNQQMKNFGVESNLKEDDVDGKEILQFVVPRRYGVWYIGTQGSTGFEKVDVSGDDINSSELNLSADNLAKSAGNLKIMANKYKTIVNTASNELNKASDEINKLRDADLKGALDYEEKAKARKNANIAYKIATQVTFQTLGQAQDVISGSLALLSILSSAYKKA